MQINCIWQYFQNSLAVTWKNGTKIYLVPLDTEFNGK